MKGSNNVENIKFVAPFDLPENYVFDATVDGRSFQVRVPIGGLQEGDIIDLNDYIKSDDSQPLTKVKGDKDNNSKDRNSAPVGYWRHGLLSCCDVVHSSILWTSLFFPWILLGQLMQRLKLNFWGCKCGTYQNTCAVVSSFVVISTLIQATLIFCYVKYENDLILSIVGAIFCYEIITLLFLSIQLRMEVRRKFSIPESCCSQSCASCDDICVSLWCQCCSLIQMGRHTHDEELYTYHSCTSTGLGPEADEDKSAQLLRV